MNEWDRLSEMSTGTRRYLNKPEVRDLARTAAAKMAKIELAKRRLERGHQRQPSQSDPAYTELPSAPVHQPPPPHSFAVELPGSDIPVRNRESSGRSTPPRSRGSSNPSSGLRYTHSESATSSDKFVVSAPEEPSPRGSAELSYRTGDDHRFNHASHGTVSPPRSDDGRHTWTEAPPRPPKTPINDYTKAPPPPPISRPGVHPRLPYPDTDGPPPMVNKMRKPEFTAR